MTRDEIIRMAREAGFHVEGKDILMPQWERFAALVAAAEREACAVTAENRKDTGDSVGIERDIQLWNLAVKSCAVAIRARGNHD